MGSSIYLGKVLSAGTKGCNIILPTVASFTGLLDTYSGAAAAYSLRKLRSAYTGSAIRVRRSDDNTEQDFGFVNNVLDTASLLTFCGFGNGFVTTWYDQSGNGNNATQSTAANQPQIVSFGSMVTTNSKNSISFDGINDYLNLNSNISVSSSNFTTFAGKRTTSGKLLYGLGGGSLQQYLAGLFNDNNYYFQGKTTSYIGSSSADTTSNQIIFTGQNSGGTLSMFKNGNIITSNSVSFNLTMGIGSIGNYYNYSILSYVITGNLQEIIYFNSDQSSNRIGIESNINTFYNIY